MRPTSKVIQLNPSWNKRASDETCYLALCADGSIYFFYPFSRDQKWELITEFNGVIYE